MMPRWTQTFEERFWSKVDRDGPIPDARPDLGPCWVWRRIVAGNGGYGKFRVGQRMMQAYRVAYELLIGPVPENLELDHLCRVTACVNPGHLEPVTHRENMLRGENPSADHARMTHCAEGHPLFGENLYLYKSGLRRCWTCKRAYDRTWAAKARAEKRRAA